MTDDEARLDKLLALCGMKRTGETKEWVFEGPHQEPTCPDCGVVVRIAFDIKAGMQQHVIQVFHPTPVCAEFARRLEELP